MSRMRTIIFMLGSISIFMAIHAGDAPNEEATKEEVTEQKQQDIAPEVAPKQEEKKPEAPPAPEEEPEAEPEAQPQDEPTDAVEEVTEELVPEAVEPAPPEQPKAAEITEEAQIETPEIEPTVTPDESEEEKVAVLGPKQEESVPLPPEPAEEPIVEDLEVVEPQGIDTVDIDDPEGNWLFKRIWWEKGKELFSKILDYVDKIVESRMHFFEERVKLDRDRLDPFYVAIGLDQGALMQQVDYLLDVLKRERERDGVLNEQELELYNVLTEEKVTLNQLHEAVIDIQRVDSGLDRSLQILMEQINLARAYEREAWQLLNRIAEELNDKKAREHYYAIATIWRNVKEIGAYITGPFAKHFVRLASSTVQRIDQIQDTLELLKEKGVELSKEGEALQQPCDLEDDEDIEEEEEPAAPVGWFDWIWQTVTGWFTW